MPIEVFSLSFSGYQVIFSAIPSPDQRSSGLCMLVRECEVRQFFGSYFKHPLIYTACLKCVLPYDYRLSEHGFCLKVGEADKLALRILNGPPEAW